MSNLYQHLKSSKCLSMPGSGGREKHWQIHAYTGPNGEAYLQSSYWFVKDRQESAVTTSSMKEIKGKNQGRSNATSAAEQAVKELDSKVLQQIDKGYWPVDEPRPEQLPLPMLAKTFDPTKASWPKLVQPKLDGVRCLYDGAKAWSRKGKLFSPEIMEHLKNIQVPTGTILDGELMLPQGEYTFQETVSAIKRWQPEVSYKLVFYVYDCIIRNGMDEGCGFIGRSKWYESVLWPQEMDAEGALPVRTVPTMVCTSWREAEKQHGYYIEDGYEGTILRDPDAPYAINQRSDGLLKHKDFIDAEFVITGATEGSGKDAGTVIFQCMTDNDRRFLVRPRGTHAARTRMFNEREELIGKMLTVRYQNLTDEGVPRFPVGIAVRDYE